MEYVYIYNIYIYIITPYFSTGLENLGFLPETSGFSTDPTFFAGLCS